MTILRFGEALNLSVLSVSNTHFFEAMEVPKSYGYVLQYVMGNRSKNAILEVSGDDTVVSDNEQLKGGEGGDNDVRRIFFACYMLLILGWGGR